MSTGYIHRVIFRQKEIQSFHWETTRDREFSLVNKRESLFSGQQQVESYFWLTKAFSLVNKR